VALRAPAVGPHSIDEPALLGVVAIVGPLPF